jgi:probable phosphoglycerate mutase
MKRLVLVRHGESEWNAGRRLQGQADIGLSPRGEEQARALRPLVAGLQPVRVVASSLRRARDTATLLGFPDAALVDDLREIDVGEWTGAAIDDLAARADGAYRKWRAGLHTPPGGEAWEGFKARTAGGVRLILDSAEGNVLVVSHGGVVRALLESLLALSPDRIVPVAPGSLTVLQCHSPEWRLEVFNYSPGGPTLDAPD